MKKILLFIILLLPFYIYALDYPELNSKNVIVYDLTDNRLLYEKNSNDKTPIASLTKIATTITAIETIDDLDEEVIITKDILDKVDDEASTAKLKVNDKVTYKDLLYATILPSGADASLAIAILSSGNEEAFVEKMNNLVDKIGLTNTHFNNVHGLDNPDHYSTAADLLKLLEYSLNNPTFKKIYTTKEYTLSNGLKVTSTLNMFKKIDTSKIQGSKTGFTKQAGYCLSSLSNIKGFDIIVITINGEKKKNAYYSIVDTMNIINFIDNNYIKYTIPNDQIIDKIPVNLSNINTITITSHDDVNILLPKDYNYKDIKTEYDGLKTFSFLNKKGENIGTINYYYQDELIYQEDIILNTSIKPSLEKIIAKYFYIVIILIVIIFIIINKDIISKIITIKKD
jgi:D-alanyl-D-alanine carboxypeptidase (penicillin-binding protein 5/6)